MNFFQQFGPLLGRILIAALFIPAGLGKLAGFEGTVGYIAAQGLPLPALGAAGAIAVEVGGALALLLGYKARWAALVLALFTLVTAFVFHNFWAAPADQQMAQSINFYKNLAIAGGLLFVVAFGAGPKALDKAG
ncbi:DoxX family protein [Methylibium sp.]|uniref:DoxX family protein n=1 Tax=Methylibium sp. TaxID=2067992 RepID=UPI003D1050B5